MQIAFYIHHTTLKAGGIFTYTVGILKLLLASDDVKKIYLVYSSELSDYVKENFDHPKIKSVVVDRKSKLVDIRLKLAYFLYDTYFIYSHYFGSADKLRFLKRLSNVFNPYRVIETLGVDVFQVPMQYSPIYGTKIPVLITMHDLQELHFPQFFDSGERMHRAINTKKAMEESDKIIVSFPHVKRDILKFYGTADNKVHVCTPPISESWFGSVEATPLEELKAKYDIPDNFLLLPAATWQHKNHITLLKSMKLLKDKGKELFLVSTGNKTDYYNEIENFLKENNMEGNAIFTGIVSEEDLIGFFKNTSLVVIPTLYEAGSGPLFEAMRYGAPAICSNVTSLPDTVQDKRFIFDPHDEEALADMIEKMLDDEDFRKANLSNASKRLEYYKSLDYYKSFGELYLSV